MSKLSAATRQAMLASEFAGKNKSFPVNDANHARAAISGASRAENAGNLSEAGADRIKDIAKRKLGFPIGDCAHGDCSSMAHPS